MKRYNIYDILFTRTAKKQFESLSDKVKQEITKILENEIARNPLIGKPLKEPLKGLRSQRIGNLRIIYEFIKNKLVIIVINIEHRKRVYKHKK